MHKRKGRNPSKISLNLLKRCVFLIHWRCCTIYETHRRRVKAMVFQIMTELEEKEQRQKLRDAWPHRKFTLTSSSSWIIPSVVNGFTKMKTTMALRMARPKCHQYSHLAAKARDNGKLTTAHPERACVASQGIRSSKSLMQSKRSTLQHCFLSTTYHRS